MREETPADVGAGEAPKPVPAAVVGLFVPVGLVEPVTGVEGEAVSSLEGERVS